MNAYPVDTTNYPTKKEKERVPTEEEKEEAILEEEAKEEVGVLEAPIFHDGMGVDSNWVPSTENVVEVAYETLQFVCR